MAVQCSLALHAVTNIYNNTSKTRCITRYSVRWQHAYGSLKRYLATVPCVTVIFAVQSNNTNNYTLYAIKSQGRTGMRLAVQSSLAVTRARPANWTSHSREVWPRSIRSSRAAAPPGGAVVEGARGVVSQSRTVRSSEPEARVQPSGDHRSLQLT